MKLIIDYIEKDLVVCEREDGSQVHLDREKVPTEAKDGDVLIMSNDVYIIDKLSTTSRKKQIEKLTEELWNEEKKS